MFNVGQKIAQYTLVRKLGKGGFGEVWLAERQSQFFTKKVAVKLPHAEQVDFETIKREAVLWEEASGHPNVLPIIDADVYDGQVVIVSEYADGGSLADKLKADGKLPAKQAVEMTVGILNGLEYLHSKQIIHRDIKPQNILLQGSTPRLADFGISRAMNTLTISSVVVGTDAYMSPEAFDGKRNVQTDIWSVGVVLYQLLKGDLPFPQEHPSERLFAILTKEFKSLSDEFPTDLRRIVQKALAKTPEERYQSAGEMHEDLQKALVGISHPTFAPTEILHKPITPDLQSKSPTTQTDAATLQTNAPSIQTEIRTTQTEKPTEQFTRPAIETNQPPDAPSIVTQIKPSQTDESAKPLPTVAQAFADKTYDSRTNNKILYYAGAGALGLLLLLGAFVIYYSSGSKVSNQANLSNSIETNANTQSNSSIADKRLIPYKKGLHFGFVDENKKIVIEPKYYKVQPFIDGLAFVEGGSEAYYAFIDKTDKEVIPLKYLFPQPFKEDLALVQLEQKYGFVDKTGKEVIPPKYEFAYSFSDGLAYVTLNGKSQYIDKSGNVVLPPADKYSYFDSFSEGLAVVESENRKYGYIDKTGKVVISPQFDFAVKFSEGLALVKIKDKVGFIDKTGKMVIPPKFDQIPNEWIFGFKEDLACKCQVTDRCGFIDKTGTFVIPPTFEFCYNFSEGLAAVKLNNRIGFIDKAGKEVIPFKYLQGFEFKNGFSLVRFGKDYYSGIDIYIDKNGTEYYEP